MSYSVRSRLDKIAERIVDPDECKGVVTVFIQPGEQVPPDAARCQLCGEVHVCEITEFIVGE